MHHDGNTEDLPGQDTHPSPPDPADADLERRPDNVGQSGRWRHKQTEKTSPRYGTKKRPTRRIRGGRPPAATRGRKPIRLK